MSRGGRNRKKNTWGRSVDEDNSVEAAMAAASAELDSMPYDERGQCVSCGEFTDIDRTQWCKPCVAILEGADGEPTSSVLIREPNPDVPVVVHKGNCRECGEFDLALDEHSVCPDCNAWEAACLAKEGGDDSAIDKMLASLEGKRLEATGTPTPIGFQPTTKPAEPKKLGKCTCNGPGSAEQKFSSHIYTCPANPNPQPVFSKTNYKSCKHNMQDFELQDELVIFPSAYRDVPNNRSAKDSPELGIYFYSSWLSGAIVATPGLDLPAEVTDHGYPLVYIEWPDYGVPADINVVIALGRWTLTKCADNIVETACMGGHGRTGTFLACLLALQGVKPGTAIMRVRTEYCFHAVESEKQCEMVAKVYEKHTGDHNWRSGDKAEAKLFREESGKGKHKWTAPSKGGSTSGGKMCGKCQRWFCVCDDKSPGILSAGFGHI